MEYERIHLTGASGSGTTTLGRTLAETLGYSHFDADDFYWLPTQPKFQVKRDKIERLNMLWDCYNESNKTVLSGSVVDWDKRLDASFDLVIFLWIPSKIRLERLEQREIERYGFINQEFIDWAARYDTGDMTLRSRVRHEAWLETLQCDILSLEGDFSNKERLGRVLEKLSVSPSRHVVEILKKTKI
jgi:adenylate kinase family enzyme